MALPDPDAEQADAMMARFKKLKDSIINYTLRLRDLPLYGPVTGTYLTDVVSSCSKHGDLDRLIKEWFEEKGFIMKCANVVAYETHWSGDIPCPKCVRDKAECRHEWCHKDDCTLRTCPKVHNILIVMIHAALVEGGLSHALATDLRKIWWECHEWDLEPREYHKAFNNRVLHGRKSLPPTGSAKIIGFNPGDNDNGIPLHMRGIGNARWPQTLVKLNPYKDMIAKERQEQGVAEFEQRKKAREENAAATAQAMAGNNTTSQHPPPVDVDKLVGKERGMDVGSSTPDSQEEEGTSTSAPQTEVDPKKALTAWQASAGPKGGFTTEYNKGREYRKPPPEEIRPDVHAPREGTLKETAVKTGKDASGKRIKLETSTRIHGAKSSDWADEAQKQDESTSPAQEEAVAKPAAQEEAEVQQPAQELSKVEGKKPVREEKPEDEPAEERPSSE